MASKVLQVNSKRTQKMQKLNNKKVKIVKQKKIKVQEFTIVKDVTEKKKIKVERVLPYWLSHPIYINKHFNSDEQSLKESCPILNDKLINKLKNKKILHLFPVQQIIIPEILASVNMMENRFLPRDICVATPTGSGKTLSYVIPVVQAIGFKSVPAIRALVILPVIELANQVFKVFSTYAVAFKLKVGQAFGSEHFAKEQKELITSVYNEHQCKIDILVATPGRLLEHMQHTPGLDFSQVRFLILDEADKLFVGEGGDVIARIQQWIAESKESIQNRGLRIPPFFSTTSEQTNFENESIHKLFSPIHSPEDSADLCPNYISSYLSSTSPPMQRLLFSATLSHDPQQLQNLSLYRPILFTTKPESGDSFVKADCVSKVARPSSLVEEWLRVDSSLKPLMLHYLLHLERKKMENFKALVFSSSLELSSKISILLKELSKGKYSVEEFSSKFSKSRKKKLSNFLQGSINVLVSSDATARGIDFQNVDCVISYDIPSTNTYIHRIGRTARAGKTGRAISLVTEDDYKTFKKITGPEFAKLNQRKVPEQKLEKLESRFKLSLEVLASAMKSRKQKGAKRIPITLKRKKIKKTR